MSYYCTNCGAKLENGATQCPQCGAKMKYCPYCGSKFNDDEAEAQLVSPAAGGVEAAAVACSQLVDGIQGEGQEAEGAPAEEGQALDAGEAAASVAEESPASDVAASVEEAAPADGAAPADEAAVQTAEAEPAAEGAPAEAQQAAAPEQVGAPAAPQASASVAPAPQASASAKAAPQPAAAKSGTAAEEEKGGHGCLTVFLTVLFTIVLIVLVIVVGVNVIGSEDLEYQIEIAMTDQYCTELIEDEVEEDEVEREITWASTDAASALPVPDWAEEDEDGDYTLTGWLLFSSSSNYVVYAQIDSRSDYNEYVSACKEAGYTENVINTGKLYAAESDNGYQISIRFYGENSPYNVYDDSPMIRIWIEEID